MRTYFARLQKKVVSYTRFFTVLTALFDFAIIVTVGQRGWTYHQTNFIHFSLKRFEPVLLIAGGHSLLFFSDYYSRLSLILAKSGFYQLLW